MHNTLTHYYKSLITFIQINTLNSFVVLNSILIQNYYISYKYGCLPIMRSFGINCLFNVSVLFPPLSLGRVTYRGIILHWQSLTLSRRLRCLYLHTSRGRITFVSIDFQKSETRYISFSVICLSGTNNVKIS